MSCLENMTKAVIDRFRESQTLIQKSLEMLQGNEKDPKKNRLLHMAQINNMDIVMESSTYADFLAMKAGTFKLKIEKFNLAETINEVLDVVKL